MSDIMPSGLFVVANATDIERLRSFAFATNIDPASLVALSPDVALPDGLLREAHILVIEVDPAQPQTLRRLDNVRTSQPNLPIIAAIRQADIATIRMLVKHGVTDVAVLPFDPDELSAQIFDATARAAAMATQDTELAPLVSIVRSTGGSGATTVITHLASELARMKSFDKEICVVDLDVQGGDIAAFLGTSPKATLTNLIESAGHIDEGMVGDVASTTRYGFALIAAPHDVTPLESLNSDFVLPLLSKVRRKYGYVLVDLPADWSDWSLSTALASDKVLVIADPSISSLRQAKRRLDLFAQIGVEGARANIIVNRVQRRLFKTIGVDEVEEALGHRVVGSLADEGTELRAAQDQGLLLSDVSAKSRFGKDIAALARHLLAESDQV